MRVSEESFINALETHLDRSLFSPKEFMDAYALSDSSSMESQRVFQLLSEISTRLSWEPDSVSIRHIESLVDLLTRYLILKHQGQFNLLKEWE